MKCDFGVMGELGLGNYTGPRTSGGVLAGRLLRVEAVLSQPPISSAMWPAKANLKTRSTRTSRETSPNTQ